jgi:lipopolysaccharide transport system permease protein
MDDIRLLEGKPTESITSTNAVEHQLPVHHIRPRKGWQALALSEVWRYRGLLLALLWRDVKAAQKQTMLGVLWLFLAPLFTVAVFTVIFGRLARLPSDGIEYPLFVLAGYMVWNAFASATQAATVSVVNSSHFVQKVYFPRLLIPTSAALAGVNNLLVVFICLLLLMCCYGRWPGWATLCAIPLMLCVLLTALGLGLWLAPLNVRYRDVNHLTGFAIQIGFFLTPVVPY